MKKIFFLILIAVIAFTQKNFIIKNFNKVYYYSVCDTPIRYKTGYIDSRFNVSEPKLLADIKQAGDIWGSVVKKNLFVYDPKGSLIINLFYDKRQALSSQIIQYENNIENQKNQINPVVAQYEKDVAAFNQSKDNLNAEIQSWNDKGGAPPDIYNQIIKDQQTLQTEADRLNQTADMLNQSNNTFNADVKKLNQTVTNLNQTLEKKPEEGFFDGQKNEIYIYFVTNQDELVHTLAHEMGHALGLNHANSTDSIMYLFISSTITPSIEDREMLQELCAKKSFPEIFINRLKTNFQILTNIMINKITSK